MLGASDDGTELRGAQEGRSSSGPWGVGEMCFPPLGALTECVCVEEPHGYACTMSILFSCRRTQPTSQRDHLLPGAEGRMLCHLFLLCFLSIMSFACTMSLSLWHQRQTHLFGGSSSVGTGWTCAHPPCSTLACPCSGEEGRCTTRGR